MVFSSLEFLFLFRLTPRQQHGAKRHTANQLQLSAHVYSSLKINRFIIYNEMTSDFIPRNADDTAADPDSKSFRRTPPPACAA